MLDIHIKTIPHSSQLYPTCGDYWTNRDSSTDIRVSDMGNAEYEALVAIHELVEHVLTSRAGITEEQITAFDKQFEAARQPGNTDEPGDDPQAPYRKEHLIATGIEKIIAAYLGINWKEYEDTINHL